MGERNRHKKYSELFKNSSCAGIWRRHLLNITDVVILLGNLLILLFFTNLLILLGNLNLFTH